MCKEEVDIRGAYTFLTASEFSKHEPSESCKWNL